MWGGRAHIISTHNSADNPFNELVTDIRAGRKPYSLHRTTLDDALVDGLFPTICRVRGTRWSEAAEISQILTRRTPFVVELNDIPFKQQEQILFYIIDKLSRFVGGAMDARGNGQYLAEQAALRYGSRIEQVMLTTEWYRESMPKYKGF